MWKERQMKRDILISIQPRHSRKIFSGEKTIELRKQAWNFLEMKDRNVYVYESAPTKKIVGYWISGQFMRTTPGDMIGRGVAIVACVDADDLFEYFKGKSTGLAISCGCNYEFDTPIDPWKVEGFRPPQSWMYMTNKMREDFGL
jgi:predicted transcriptional regulator